MKAFHFSLQKVLEFRQTQLGLQEAQCKRAAAEVAGIDRARQDLLGLAERVESDTRRLPAVTGGDLAALGGFREQVRKNAQQLAARRVAAQQKLEEEQRAMLEARRRCRLLERLKEKRLKEWELARDREIEETAAESYLARWVRGQA